MSIITFASYEEPVFKSIDNIAILFTQFTFSYYYYYYHQYLLLILLITDVHCTFLIIIQILKPAIHTYHDKLYYVKIVKYLILEKVYN